MSPTSETSYDRQARASELGQQIRSASAEAPIEVSLSTSQRIIARVTDGIYREPWAAFRELCANSYDADARRVVIETNAPLFDQIVIRDDGRGMSPETLAYVVENIGGSSKRTQDGVALHTADPDDPDLSIGKRPLIGKIGIGLFAVAQLTQHFQIISKVKGEAVRTWATILLKTHSEEALKEAGERKFEAGKALIVSEKVPDTELEAHGTTIVLHDLRPEIRNILQSIERWQAGQDIGPGGEILTPPPLFHIGKPGKNGIEPADGNAKLPWGDETDPLARFKLLYQAASASTASMQRSFSLDHLDEYLQSIWKLSLSLPLEYLNRHPFDQGEADSKIFLRIGNAKAVDLKFQKGETLRSHFGLTAGTPDPLGGFDILFDGVLLRRPIDLPDKLNRSSRISAPVMLAAKVEAPFSESALGRAGGTLKFEAYLYWNSQISPKDTQGVLLRVREASGTLFDRRFLNYQVSEQNRLSQITSEIFVTEGLDGAINIDRESFNYSHPHYVFIQKWLHRTLRILVNRLKLMASDDLGREKSEKRTKTRKATIAEAVSVWNRIQGEEADLPTSLGNEEVRADSAESPEVIDSEAAWLKAFAEDDKTLATSISIVLEAYELFTALREDQKARLLNDIVRVIRVSHPK